MEYNYLWDGCWGGGFVFVCRCECIVVSSPDILLRKLISTKLAVPHTQHTQIVTYIPYIPFSFFSHFALCLISTLDLSKNHIKDPSVMSVLEQLPDLRVLYLKGNPFVKEVRVM